MIRKARRGILSNAKGDTEGERGSHDFGGEVEDEIENAREGMSMLTRGAEQQLGNKSAGWNEERDYPNHQRFDLFTYDNFFLVVFMVQIGFLYRFPLVSWREFLRTDLKLEPAQQQAIFEVVKNFPWTMKLFVGFMSDYLPIAGLRRKPYILFGLVLAALAGYGTSKSTGAGTFSIFLFLESFGTMCTEVAVDSIVVERVQRYEHGEDIGKTQTTLWVIYFTGSCMGYFLGGYFLIIFPHAYQWAMFFCCCCRVLVIPFLYTLREEPDQKVRTLAFQANALWKRIKSLSVLPTLTFMYVLNAIPHSTDSTINFYLGPLHFTDFDLGIMSSIGVVGSVIGVSMYKMMCMKVNVRLLTSLMLFLIVAAMLLQLVLIFRINKALGIPDMVFAIGDESWKTILDNVVSAPLLVYSTRICGTEVPGATYAMLSSVRETAHIFGGALGNLLTEHFHIRQADFSNLWKLVTACALMHLVPIFLVPFLPESISAREEALGTGVGYEWEKEYGGSESVTFGSQKWQAVSQRSDLPMEKQELLSSGDNAERLLDDEGESSECLGIVALSVVFGSMLFAIADLVVASYAISGELKHARIFSLHAVNQSKLPVRSHGF